MRPEVNTLPRVVALTVFLGISCSAGDETRPPPRADFTENIEEASFEMVWIEAGKYSMGSPDDEKFRNEHEGPVHEVELSGFWIGRFEISQEQWLAVMGENPSLFNRGGRYPAEMISWEAATEFCERLSGATGRAYTLPTEAQWEYACRAGTTTAYATGDTISSEQASFDATLPPGGKPDPNADQGPEEIGSYAPNAWGIYDMHGNVREWCRDWYYRDNYSHSPRRDPQGPREGEVRVLRGGAWDTPIDRLRSAHRYKNAAIRVRNRTGFRIAIDF